MAVTVCGSIAGVAGASPAICADRERSTVGDGDAGGRLRGLARLLAGVRDGVAAWVVAAWVVAGADAVGGGPVVDPAPYI